MSGHLVRQVTGTAIGVLVLALVATGLATAVLLHGRAVKTHDEALLAAAHAWRESLGQDGSSPWEAEHSVAPVALSLLTLSQAGLPEPIFEGDEEDARFTTVDGQRQLRLPVEIERGEEDQDVHAAIVATAPAVTLVDSVGFFSIAYGLVALLMALGGGSLLTRRLELAVAPLARASTDVREVARAGQGARVTVQGPAEVQELLTEVNDLLTRLDAAFATQTRFTAEAAHELRTPVTVLRGELDLALRRERSPQELAATMRRLDQQVDRLARLVEGLMALARLDSGHAERDRVLLPIAGLVMAAVRQEGAALEAAGCQLTVELGELGAKQVSVHEALFIAALANLLRNAAVHAPGAAVHVSAAAADTVVLLSVDDAGPGIPGADQVAIFDRLQRGEHSRPTSNGLGLGLALAREVARRHGGDCALGDSPLGGARFTMYIPLAG